VPGATPKVAIPLRARSASDEDPVHVDVFVDGKPGEDVTIAGRDWQTMNVELPPNPAKRFHQLDLQIRPSDRSEILERGPAPVEVGNWEIITKPNG